MNENINLCEILKDCPKGTVIFSCDYGDVTINNVFLNSIEVLLRNESICYYTESGYHDEKYHGDCLLWPSKDCRDWSKWKCPKSENLKALCQRCHNQYDAQHRKETRKGNSAT